LKRSYYEVSGIAYSGTGRISRVMVSADGGIAAVGQVGEGRGRHDR
jgi:hypothetical protein